MTADARAKLISLLQETDGRWEAPLPARAGTFYGHRIAVQLVTHVPVWEDNSITSAERALLTCIFQELPSLLDLAKQEFDRYFSDMPDAFQYIAHVQIQLERETPESKIWTLNIDCRDSDSVFYVWFDGLRFTKAWCGD